MTAPTVDRTQIPATLIREMGKEFGLLRSEVNSLKRGLRAAQLGNSSIDDGYISFYDDGVLAATIGKAGDGVYATEYFNAAIPPQPNSPILEPFGGGINVIWNGEFVDGTPIPKNFRFIEIYCLSTSTGIPGTSNYIGTMTEPGSFPHTGLDSNSTYYYLFIATNNAEKVVGTGIRATASPPSNITSAQPGLVVGQDILDGIVTEVKLADEAVSQGKIKVGAVGTAQLGDQVVTLANLADGSVNALKLVDDSITGDKIAPLTIQAANVADEAITGPKIVASAIDADKIAANAITADKIESEAVTAGKIAANAVTAGTVAANVIGADQLAANSVIAGKIAANSIGANEIIAGSITGDRLVAETIQAGHLAAGSVTTAKLDALAVNADKIAANAINSGHIQAGSVTANKLEADLVIVKRIIAGSLTGARVEMHPTSGLQAFDTGGANRTLWINASTGAATLVGEISTAFAGTRIRINPGNVNPDQIRFYNGSSYGYINAEPGWDGGAAIAIRSQVVNNREGGVFAYGSEAAIEWKATNSPNPNTGNQMSAISCVDGATNIWGGNVTLQARARLNSGVVDFQYRDTNDNLSSGATLRYTRQGGAAPFLYGLTGNVGWQFAHNGEIYCYAADQSLRGAYGAYWNSPSSRTTKKNVEKARFNRGAKARNSIRAVKVKQWNYAEERTADDPAPPPLNRKMHMPRRDENGRHMTDYRGNPLYDEIEIPEPTPLISKPHFFPVAEELREVMPELVIENDQVPGGYGIDLRDIVGYLWQVCQEQEEQLALMQRSMGTDEVLLVQESHVDPLIPTGSGGLYARNGTLYWKNSTGQVKRVA